MLVRKGGTNIKLIDFGLARKLQGKPVKVVHGSPDFISPEVLNYEEVTTATDMWSIGVITYVLLSGVSPFEEDDDNPEVLNANITKCEWDFDDPRFEEVTDEGKDFISKLIVKNTRFVLFIYLSISLC